MKSYLYNDSIGRESVKELVDWLNSNEGKVTIYLTSSGGDVWSMQVLQRVLNVNYERIKLIAVGNIASCAFKLFFSVQCQREVFDNTQGTFHLFNKTIKLDQTGQPVYEGDRFDMKEFKRELPGMLRWSRELGMDEDELKKLEDNEDIFFDTARLRIFLATLLEIK